MTNYNYYGPSTVNNSSTVVTGSSNSGSPASSGGDGDEADGDECPAGGDCSGELAELDELDSFGELTQGFLDRLAASPIIASVSGIGSAMPSGSCPDWDMEVFDQTISLSAPMCSVWSTIAPILSAVMLVAWGLLATRIVLSA